MDCIQSYKGGTVGSTRLGRSGIVAMTAALSTILRPTLAQQVAEKIVEAVADGAIRPGERITDSDIAQRLGVSRNPVREAMKMLEALRAAR